MTAVILAGSYAALVNLLAFELFRRDKRRATTGDWRIRESTLLAVALVGGWIGAKLGQRRFRHKTRKQPFARRLNGMGVASVGLAIAVATAVEFGPAAAGFAWGDVGAMLARAAAGDAEVGAPRPGPRPRRFGPGSGDGM